MSLNKNVAEWKLFDDNHMRAFIRLAQRSRLQTKLHLTIT